MALSLRLSRFHAFARRHLPAPPARLLEVGCGDGRLALALAADGYDMVAIDPEAPEGEIFRRLSLEELDEPGAFDAAVASLSLHHVQDLESAATGLAALLRPEGTLVVQELARERHAGATARWHYERRKALAGPAGAEPPESFESWLEETDARLGHLHTFAAVEGALERSFRADEVEDVAYLYGWDLDDAVEPDEQAAIDSGAIAPTGVLWAGTRASVS